MRQSPGQLAEVISLIAIALTVALAGRAILAQLHHFEPYAVVMLGLGTLGFMLSIRRVHAAGGSNRLEMTRRTTYLAGLILVVWAVVSPARWVIGASIAAIEVALAFDIFSRLTARAKE